MRASASFAGLTALAAATALASGAFASAISASPRIVSADTASTGSLYAAMEFGQFVRYKYRDEDFRDSWRNRAYLDYTMRHAYGERFDVAIGLGAFIWYNTFPKERNEDVFNFDSKRTSLFISEARGSYAFGDPARPYVQASAGIFPYKYNPDARDLGEYMFRTGAYPNFILGDFDQAFANLTGFKFSSAYFPRWHNDLILNTETDIWPHFDWNVTYITSYDAARVFNVGAGASLTNVLSVNSDFTTPKTLKNMYVTDLRSDSAVLPGTDIKYEVITGDTGYYTFKSLKLMARAAFDPQAARRLGPLGRDDLKLYAEIAVLGWKNYPRPTPSDTAQINSFFTDRWERMPVMIGFNLPAFKLLDVLSLEVEWYGLKGPDSFQRRIEELVPMPQSVSLWNTKNASYTNADYVGTDDWKWSLYAKKALLPGWEIVAQAARDHVRHNFDSPVQLDREEALTRPGQWWWACKMQFHP